MGATGWYYITPYQSDINQALQSLRRKILESGEYKGTDIFLRKTFDGFWDELPPDAKSDIEAEIRKLQNQPKALTPEDAIAQAGGLDTHSILDIYYISDVPDYGSASPLTHSEMLEVFGTTTPEISNINFSDLTSTLHNYRYRGQAVYIILYEQFQPTTIFFSGFTGS